MPTEFFEHDSNLTSDKIMLVNDHHYTGLSQLTGDERFRILNLLKVSDRAMHSIASMGEYGINTIDGKLRRFIRCNFGELDRIDDITEKNILNFEYVNCGFKGNNHCPWAKKFCIIKNKL